MTRIQFIVAASLAAVFAWGCGSTSNSGATGGTLAPKVGDVCDASSKSVCSADGKSLLVCDPATKKYVSKSCGAAECLAGNSGAKCDSVDDQDAGTDGGGGGGSDAGGGTDAGGGAVDAGGGGGVDAGGGAVDAGPAKPAKCLETDNLCVQACSMKACGDQVQACQLDLKCSKMIGCLQNCQKTPPVELPGEATQTCRQKCYNSFGDDATQKFYASNMCLMSQCLAMPYTTPCGQTDGKCQNACLFDMCDDVVMECIKDKGCILLMSCIQSQCTNPATQQQCIGGCQQKVADTLGLDSAQGAQLLFGKLMGCGQKNCL